MKAFYIKTFGCRLNQYQSEKIREWLLACNLSLAEDPQEADLLIVNGCVVTHRGERDTRKYVNKYAKVGKKVIATGCFAKLPNLNKLPNTAYIELDKIKKVFTPIFKPKPFPSRHRILIGIQEGCNFKCTYCIVPFVRGKARDRKKEEIIREIEEYVKEGAREIVITGTDIGSYGKTQHTSLVDLIKEIKQQFPQLYIRISSILPLYITDEVVSLFKENLVLPHIHLPLQSGSPKVLKEMKRPYKLEKFLDAFEKLYAAHPNIAIGSDIIVGFPTETEEDFKKTYELIENLPFAYVHVFLYSKRPFTPAFNLNELPYEVIKRREKLLLKLVENKKKKFLQKFKGKSLRGIVEKEHNFTVTGTTENYIKFTAKTTKLIRPGTYVRITIESFTGNSAISKIENLL